MPNVSIYERNEVLWDHSLEPLNPHPVFPQWGLYDVYPYQFMGSVQYHRLRKPFRMVYIENEFLKICVAPDIGGRVWFIWDKVTKRHAINYSPEVLTYNAGFGLNYTCAGLEVNYPLAHSCPTSRKREYKVFRETDGSASVMIAEYEQIWRTRWFVKYTLRQGRSFLEHTVRIYNRSLHDSRYMYWGNCGFTVNDQTQFIFPEKAGAMHGKEANTLSWPVWKQKDLSYWKNVVEPLGLYMLDAEEPYFGYYDHGAKYGFVHYGDLSNLPGKKYWSWGGAAFGGRIATAKTHNSDGKPYGEMQSGRIVIQEHLDRMPPESEAEWTEYWYPVRDMEGFNGVGRDAAINVKILNRDKNVIRLAIKAIGSGTFRDAFFIVSGKGSVLAHQKIDITPSAATQRHLRVTYKTDNPGTLSVKLVRKDGEVLVQTVLREPSRQDSWLKVRSETTDCKRKSSEEIFMEGENMARDWYNHDECTMYEEALKVDPGLSSAHLEIGKAKTFRGDYTTAINHLKKATGRNPGNLDSYYSLGVALMLAGDTEQACRNLEKAARYDCEWRSRTRLAEIKIREKDLHHALRYLERVTKGSPRLTRPMTLKAICMRYLSRFDEALQVVKVAREVDPMDPFPQMEEMLIEQRLKPGSIKDRVKKLLVQIRNYEPPYFDAVLDYGNLGLYGDALTFLRLFPSRGPIALLYQAYAEYKLNRKSWKRTLEAALRQNPVNHCVWQLEFISVLQWAMEALPQSPRSRYHLGNLLVARRRFDEGVVMWEEAQKLREKSYLLYSNLGYYRFNIVKDSKKALQYFRLAHKMEPDDPYVKVEIFNILKSLGHVKEAVNFFERDIANVRQYPKLAHVLMSEYIEQKQYGKFDALIPDLHFEGNWPIAGPHSLWMTRFINEALDTMAEGQYRKAMDLFKRSVEVPSGLGVCHIEREKQERILYHMGRCYEKLGSDSDARRTWEQAVRIDREYAWEPSCAYGTWIQRYFQALCLKKLGRPSEANIIFDGMELMITSSEIPEVGRQYLKDLVLRGKFGKEEEQDPYTKKSVDVQSRAEL